MNRLSEIEKSSLSGVFICSIEAIFNGLIYITVYSPKYDVIIVGFE